MIRLEDTHCEVQLNKLNFTVGIKLHFYTERWILSISYTEITITLDLFAAVMDRRRSFTVHMLQDRLEPLNQRYYSIFMQVLEAL